MAYAFNSNYKYGLAQNLFKEDVNHSFLVFSNGCLSMGIIAVLLSLILLIHHYKKIYIKPKV